MEDMKSRILKIKLYNSKDTAIVNNPPDLECDDNLTEINWAFVCGELHFYVNIRDIKACHYLGSTLESAIIVKVTFIQKTSHGDQKGNFSTWKATKISLFIWLRALPLLAENFFDSSGQGNWNSD